MNTNKLILLTLVIVTFMATNVLAVEPFGANYTEIKSERGPMDQAQDHEALAGNLTSTPLVKQFNLTSRIDDITDDTIKPTYWRIYVPRGVAGTCTGNIVFGATKAPEV
jgi:hypothetical protein